MTLQIESQLPLLDAALTPTEVDAADVNINTASACASSSAPSRPFDVESELTAVGYYSNFQRIHCGAGLYAWLLGAMATMIGVFDRYHPVCAASMPKCTSSTYTLHDYCHQSAAALVLSKAASSIGKDFGIACSPLLDLSSTMFFTGHLCGVFLSGRFSDSYGRRQCCRLTFGIFCIAQLAAPLAPNYGFYCASRFGVGAGIGGLSLVIYILGTECLRATHQPRFLFAMNASYVVGVGAACAGSYLFPFWRAFNWVVLVFLVPFVLFCIPNATWCLTDGPKWVALQQNADKMRSLLQHIATVNGRVQYTPPSSFAWANTADAASSETVAHVDHWTLMFRHPVLAFRNVVLCSSWAAIAFGYYGMTMNVADENLGANFYASNFFMSLIEIPGYVLAAIVPNISGRRSATVMCFVLAGICCCVSALISSSHVLLPLGLTGKLCFAFAFAMMYLYSVELMPCSLRNTTVGFQSMCARFGSIVAPFAGALFPTSEGLIAEPMMLAFGVPALVCAVLACFLPETLNKSIPATVNDLHQGNPRDSLAVAVAAAVADHSQPGLTTNGSQVGDLDATSPHHAYHFMQESTGNPNQVERQKLSTTSARQVEGFSSVQDCAESDAALL